MCFTPTRYFTKVSYITVISYISVIINVSIVNVISFSSLDQQLLRSSPLLDHVMEMTCHLFKSVKFGFEEGNLRSGLIEPLPSFAIAT